jgi:hypothetical protein
LVVIFVYYVLLTVGQTLAEKGPLPPFLALWMPNVILFSVGLFLFSKAAQESPVLALHRLELLWARARSQVLERLAAREAR